MCCRVTCVHTCCRSTKRGKPLHGVVSRWLSPYQPPWGRCVTAFPSFPSSISIPPLMAPLSQCEKMGLFAIGALNLNPWRPNICLYVSICVRSFQCFKDKSGSTLYVSYCQQTPWKEPSQMSVWHSALHVLLLFLVMAQMYKNSQIGQDYQFI